jgi:F0F1-type ATP synthase epsilon subunit
MQTLSTSTELTIEKVNEAVNAILEVLGTPETELHTKALAAFQSGDHQIVKRLSSTHLSDYYVKALGYLGGALKLTPNTDTILAESARSAADFTKERALKQLGEAIAKALN